MNPFRSLRALLLAAALVLCLPVPSALAGDWIPAEIVGPPGSRFLQPNAINNHGVVVGNIRLEGNAYNSAFRWENGTMQILPGTGYETRAYDVNDAGVIVGWSQPAAGQQTTGAVWAPPFYNLSLTAFNVAGREGSQARGINEKGEIVGAAGDEGVFPPPWDRPWETQFAAYGTGGGWATFRYPYGEFEEPGRRWISVYGGTAYKINAHGQIMGMGGPDGGRAWIANGPGQPGPQVDVYPGDQGFNDLGHIVGRSGFSDPNRDPFTARFWDGSQVIDIGDGAKRLRANAVNNDDWIVGRAGVEDWQAEYRTHSGAWLWRPTEGLVELAFLGPAGWGYANARDVNDDGVIVGVGQRGGRDIGFTLTPAGTAHRLSGTVVGLDGKPVAGARLQILNAAGAEVTPAVTTGADGRYETTLLRGSYRITVLPNGGFAPILGTGCQPVDVYTCAIGMTRNRVVDFVGAGAGGSGGGGGDSRDVTPPAVRTPRANTLLAAVGGKTVNVRLGPFAEAVAGTVALEQPAPRARGRRTSRRARRSAKARAVKLGSKRFSARAGRAVVVSVPLNRAGKRLLAKGKVVRAQLVVTARDAAGNTTVKRVNVRLKATRARRGAKGRRDAKGKRGAKGRRGAKGGKR